MATHWAILDRLSISGVPRLEDVQQHGYNAIISVNTHPTPPEAVPEGVETYHLKMTDGQLTPTNFAHLNLAMLAGIELIEDGRKVLVHCRAGRDRSGTTAALITRYYFGYSGIEVLDFVRARRPRAIANTWFDAYLRSLPHGTEALAPGPGRGMR